MPNAASSDLLFERRSRPSASWLGVVVGSLCIHALAIGLLRGWTARPGSPAGTEPHSQISPIEFVRLPAASVPAPAAPPAPSRPLAPAVPPATAAIAAPPAAPPAPPAAPQTAPPAAPEIAAPAAPNPRPEPAARAFKPAAPLATGEASPAASPAAPSPSPSASAPPIAPPIVPPVAAPSPTPSPVPPPAGPLTSGEQLPPVPVPPRADQVAEQPPSQPSRGVSMRVVAMRPSDRDVPDAVPLDRLPQPVVDPTLDYSSAFPIVAERTVMLLVQLDQTGRVQQVESLQPEPLVSGDRECIDHAKRLLTRMQFPPPQQQGAVVSSSQFYLELKLEPL